MILFQVNQNLRDGVQDIFLIIFFTNNGTKLMYLIIKKKELTK